MVEKAGPLVITDTGIIPDTRMMTSDTGMILDTGMTRGTETTSTTEGTDTGTTILITGRIGIATIGIATIDTGTIGTETVTGIGTKIHIGMEATGGALVIDVDENRVPGRQS